jgi:hypothetical protein
MQLVEAPVGTPLACYRFPGLRIACSFAEEPKTGQACNHPVLCLSMLFFEACNSSSQYAAVVAAAVTDVVTQLALRGTVGST